MEQTNILTKSDKVCGKELNSAAKLESKFKTATIIVVIASFAVSLFIPIPDDENYWLAFVLIALLCVLIGWHIMSIAAFFKLSSLAKEQYRSYINETKASDILPTIMKPLAAKGCNVSADSKYEATLNITYKGREYFVSFFNKGGGYFTVGRQDYSLQNCTFNAVKFDRALEDIPMIAYAIQDTLKNAV